MKTKDVYIKEICNIYSAWNIGDDYTIKQRNDNIGKVLDEYANEMGENLNSNERKSVRKHECKKKHVKKSIYGELPNPYDLNKAPGFNKNG